MDLHVVERGEVAVAGPRAGVGWVLHTGDLRGTESDVQELLVPGRDDDGGRGLFGRVAGAKRDRLRGVPERIVETAIVVRASRSR